MRIGIGAVCSQVDSEYPTGCPSGFTLQPVCYVPNSGQPERNCTGAPAGYIPIPDGAGCPTFTCLNAQFQSPFAVQDQARESSCNLKYELIGGGAALFLLWILPGWWKLIALPIIPLTVLSSLECEGGL